MHSFSFASSVVINSGNLPGYCAGEDIERAYPLASMHAQPPPPPRGPSTRGLNLTSGSPQKSICTTQYEHASALPIRMM